MVVLRLEFLRGTEWNSKTRETDYLNKQINLDHHFFKYDSQQHHFMGLMHKLVFSNPTRKYTTLSMRLYKYKLGCLSDD